MAQVTNPSTKKTIAAATPVANVPSTRQTLKPTFARDRWPSQRRRGMTGDGGFGGGNPGRGSGGNPGRGSGGGGNTNSGQQNGGATTPGNNAFFSGIIGILLGFLAGFMLTRGLGFPFVISPVAVALAFSVSAVVGICFGFYPAVRAAKLDPIIALRTE